MIKRQCITDIETSGCLHGPDGEVEVDVAKGE